MHRPVLAILFVTTLGCGFAQGIIIRHDRPDERYIELGHQNFVVGMLGGGEGTLVAPQWVLTAAHVADGLSPFAQANFGHINYRPQAVFLHPKWRGEPGPGSPDLALVKLDRPVKDMPTVRLYTADDEAGQIVTFVGAGMTGTGQTGPTGEDGHLRGATNKCESVSGAWMTFRFDPPDKATDLEGISGPGNSGGPALVERDGQLHIVGVSSSNDTADGTGPCTYGTVEYYARVSQAVPWIRDVLDGKVEPRRDPDEKTEPYAADKLPAIPALRAAAALFDAWSAADFDAAITAFETKHRSPAALAQRGIPQRLQTWTRLRADWGTLEPQRYVAHAGGDCSIEVRTARAGMMVFRFIAARDDPTRISGVQISSTGG